VKHELHGDGELLHCEKSFNAFENISVCLASHKWKVVI